LFNLSYITAPCNIAGTRDREFTVLPRIAGLERPTYRGEKDRGGNGKRWERRKGTGGRFL